MFEVIRNEAFFRRMLLEAVNKFLWSSLALVEAILGIRFFASLLSSGNGTGLVRFLGQVSRTVLAPFEAIFGVSVSEGPVFQMTSLFAMASYLVLFWMLLNMNGSMLARSPLNYRIINRSTAVATSINGQDSLENLENLENLVNPDSGWIGDREVAA